MAFFALLDCILDYVHRFTSCSYYGVQSEFSNKRTNGRGNLIRRAIGDAEEEEAPDPVCRDLSRTAINMTDGYVTVMMVGLHSGQRIVLPNLGSEWSSQ